MKQPVRFKQFQITNSYNHGQGFAWRATKDLAIDISFCPYNWTRVSEVTLPEEFTKQCHELTKTLVDVDIMGRYIKAISVNYHNSHSAALGFFGIDFEMPDQNDIPQHQCMSK